MYGTESLYVDTILVAGETSKRNITEFRCIHNVVLPRDIENTNTNGVFGCLMDKSTVFHG